MLGLSRGGTERDHLATVVFPALCEKLDKHRVRLVDIDLRCGLTQEQSDNDKALGLPPADRTVPSVLYRHPRRALRLRAQRH